MCVSIESNLTIETHSSCNKVLFPRFSHEMISEERIKIYVSREGIKSPFNVCSSYFQLCSRVTNVFKVLIIVSLINNNDETV